MLVSKVPLLSATLPERWGKLSWTKGYVLRRVPRSLVRIWRANQQSDWIVIHRNGKGHFCNGTRCRFLCWLAHVVAPAMRRLGLMKWEPKTSSLWKGLLCKLTSYQVTEWMTCRTGLMFKALSDDLKLRILKSRPGRDIDCGLCTLNRLVRIEPWTLSGAPLDLLVWLFGCWNGNWPCSKMWGLYIIA